LNFNAVIITTTKTTAATTTTTTTATFKRGALSQAKQSQKPTHKRESSSHTERTTTRERERAH